MSDKTGVWQMVVVPAAFALVVGAALVALTWPRLEAESHESYHGQTFPAPAAPTGHWQPMYYTDGTPMILPVCDGGRIIGYTQLVEWVDGPTPSP